VLAAISIGRVAGIPMRSTPTDRPLLRFAGALLVAVVVVSAMLWLGLEVSGFTATESRRVLETYEVDLLSDSQRLDLQELLGEGRYGLARPVARPALDRPGPRDDARGFVRLDVSVDERGQVTDVRVIDASPAGIFEAQAIAEIRQRRYAAGVIDGVAVPSRHLEIVAFTLAPADVLERPE